MYNINIIKVKELTLKVPNKLNFWRLISMKKFVVLMVKDESNLFDLFNQTEVLGIKDNEEEAKTLIENVKNNLVQEIEEEEGEYTVEESNDNRMIALFDEDECIYYNLMIKEF